MTRSPNGRRAVPSASVATSKTERLRRAARELGKFSLDELYERAGFGQPKGKERERLRYLVWDLCKARQLRNFDTGIYIFVGKDEEQRPKAKESPRPLAMQAKMWRVMRGLNKRKPFSRADVQQLTGGSQDYARRYMTHLKKAGFLVQVSKERYLNGTNFRPLYRIPEEKDKPETPYYRRRRLERENREKAVRKATNVDGLTAAERISLLKGLFEEGRVHVAAIEKELDGAQG